MYTFKFKLEVDYNETADSVCPVELVEEIIKLEAKYKFKLTKARYTTIISKIELKRGMTTQKWMVDSKWQDAKLDYLRRTNPYNK